MTRPLTCPSSQPDQTGAMVIGVVTGPADRRRVSMLRTLAPLDTVAGLIPPEIPVGEIVRLAGPCAEDRCRHFKESRCSLGERIAAALDPVAARPPPCAIRADCRWWNEQGAEACRRCPQIVTEPFEAAAGLREIAAPPPASPVSAQEEEPRHA